MITKILLGMSLLGTLAGTQAFAASKERGNGGTGIVFNNNKATIGDTYYKAPYQPFEIEESVTEELQKLSELSDYFNLSLPKDFWSCEVFDECTEEGNDIRLTNKLPIENIIQIDQSKMSANQIQELKYIMAYGYTTKKTTWLVKSFYEKLSTKDKALAYLHERMHTLNNTNVNHEYIMWYISGLSKLRDIDLRKAKYSSETYEYLKKYTFYAYKKIMSVEAKTDKFQHFKYSQNGEALLFYNRKKDMQKIKTDFTFSNDQSSLKYLDLTNFKVIGDSSDVTLSIATTINDKYPSPECASTEYWLERQNDMPATSCSFSIEGKNNKIIFSSANFYLGTSDNITGDNNLIVFSSNISITGSKNVVVQSSRLYVVGDENLVNHVVDYVAECKDERAGNDCHEQAVINGHKNIVTGGNFKEITGNNNFIKNVNFTKVEKNNKMKTKGDYFWHTNDHKKAKELIETLNNQFSSIFKIEE